MARDLEAMGATRCRPTRGGELKAAPAASALLVSLAEGDTPPHCSGNHSNVRATPAKPNNQLLGLAYRKLTRLRAHSQNEKRPTGPLALETIKAFRPQTKCVRPTYDQRQPHHDDGPDWRSANLLHAYG